jgi:tetratricopeptide (TPR) repeat protein
VNIKLGRLAYEEGRPADALALLDEGREAVQRIAGASGVVAEATALAGAVALERGDLEEAIDKTANAAASLAGAGDPLEALVLALRGATLCAAEDFDAAAQVFEEVDVALERGGRASIARAARTLRAPLVAAQGDPDAAQALLAEVADDRLGQRVRVARRFADKTIAFGKMPPASDVVKVADDGSWLHTPGAERVDLSRRRVLRRLLLALAEKRVSEPGALLASADLVAAGWPGEKMLEKSAQDRLWVAIRSLRRLGLEGILVTGREGYLLDPDVPLELSAADAG